MKNRFYIEQYGDYWSLSKEEMKDFLERGAKGEYEINGYDLSKYKDVKNKPTKANIFLISTLDWDTQDFKYQLDSFEEDYIISSDDFVIKKIYERTYRIEFDNKVFFIQKSEKHNYYTLYEKYDKYTDFRWGDEKATWLDVPPLKSIKAVKEYIIKNLKSEDKETQAKEETNVSNDKQIITGTDKDDILSKILETTDFRKFSSAFRKHVDKTFAKKYHDLPDGMTWEELASYLIGDGHYNPSSEQLKSLANALNIDDRGAIRLGLNADLIIFEPTSVKVNASFKQWNVLSTGFNDVFINGQYVVQDGNYKAVLAGEFVKPHTL